ncbi:lipopolysaccharide-induced tumor necrosis factor-alpha factor-like [Temnothorax curvispinosus]|uniref:Lipopolysaccharide-induced tumor necrosis factor-alpha factor-like n=1 Tax=Temnothorax curvispinosus TaxID=300111 RepID=A0A6J1RNF2_9HYME|nr:lipopolysaccharide-induced tumor necrosis factor-alpha factor-like [Temnothorax curvispinosus]XP_024867444.1 lipopolysaccharide-induced tumor necrosis factor-alpha factor-like [Temnothorax curvispinosus]XP_024867445.1 lipopolysaccharide-induced tumor necrosis factor-alpha factor-like [Temnothorax curvispinosus]XP_024867446.1 lipopolysaccharide-induced tumor necrosis factor-alpha factor-like [Temnothorax curvispinosus]XP_024894074.1 lipopolysaccharide-induced tumor necrosis factor-alpha facto
MEIEMEKMDPQPNYMSAPYSYQQPPLSMPPSPHTVHTIITPTAFSKENQRMTCPRCNVDINTRVESVPNMKTHLIAFLLCVCGCCCCAPCPYFMDSCIIHKHYCPACSSYLGESIN